MCGWVGFEHRRIESPHAVGAEIALAGNGIMVAGVGLCERRTSETARLFSPEPDHANGAKRSSGVHDVLRSRGSNRDTRSVIDRACALVPAVEMTADEQYWRLRIATRNFGDDIARMAALALLADQCQVHDHRLAALEYPDELFRVRNRQCPRGD